MTAALDGLRASRVVTLTSPGGCGKRLGTRPDGWSRRARAVLGGSVRCVPRWRRRRCCSRRTHRGRPGPFPDPVGPPPQVGIGVGTGVQVVMIRAVQPQVDEIRGGAQHARQVRPAHHAVRGPVRFQQLGQEHRPLTAQLVPASRDPRQPCLRCVQLAGMGQPAGRLDRQPEILRQPARPAAERRGPGSAVEAAVELGGTEGGGVASQPVPDGKPRRVQLGVPVIVTPP
jgi:hypothetical protein